MRSRSARPRGASNICRSIRACSDGCSSSPAAARCSWPVPRSSTAPGPPPVAAPPSREWSRERAKAEPRLGVKSQYLAATQGRPCVALLHFSQFSATPATWHEPCNHGRNRREGGGKSSWEQDDVEVRDHP